MFTILIWNKGNIFEYKFPNTSAKRKTKLAYIIHHHHSSRTWLGDHFSQQIKAYDMRQYNDKWFLREFRLAQQQHNTDNNNDFILNIIVSFISEQTYHRSEMKGTFLCSLQFSCWEGSSFSPNPLAPHFFRFSNFRAVWRLMLSISSATWKLLEIW